MSSKFAQLPCIFRTESVLFADEKVGLQKQILKKEKINKKVYISIATIDLFLNLAKKTVFWGKNPNLSNLYRCRKNAPEFVHIAHGLAGVRIVAHAMNCFCLVNVIYNHIFLLPKANEYA